MGTLSNNIVVGTVTLLPLIAVIAFCVMAEVSLVASRKTRIAELADQGDARARVVQRVMLDPNRFFATTQIGITIASLAVGVVSEPSISAWIENVLEFLNLPIPVNVVRVIGTFVGLMLASFVQIVLAELVPRAVAINRAEGVALAVVPLMAVFASIFRPFIWLLNGATRLVLRVLGIPSGASEGTLHSREELRMLLEASEEGGAIHGDDAELIENAIGFGDLNVREVMTPRTDIVGIEMDAPLARAIHIVSVNPFDRYPVYDDTNDHIKGLLHVKDLMRAMWPTPRNVKVSQLMRPDPITVPDTQKLDEVLLQLRKRNEYMAIVLDEYGGTAGLVTLDDLLDVIVGDIGENENDSNADIQATSDGVITIAGMTTLGEVNDAFDLELKDENYDTIGGYVMGALGRIPVVGDVVNIPGGPNLTVDLMDGLRVDKLRLER